MTTKGFMTIGFKMMTKVLDWNFLSLLFPYFVGFTGDFQRELKKHHELRAGKAAPK